MRNLLYISTLVVLGACGMSEDKFADKFVDAYCDAWDGCNTSTDCPVKAGESDDSDDSCEYDKKKAKECIKGDFTCNDEFGEGMEFVEPPSVCADVFKCEGADDEGGDE